MYIQNNGFITESPLSALLELYVQNYKSSNLAYNKT